MRLLCLIIIASSFSACAPMPLIQSARVTGLTGVTGGYVSPQIDVDATYRNTCTDCAQPTVQPTNERYKHDPGRILPRVGIGDRLELMAIFTPYLYPPFFLASGNVKIALFDIGGKRMFRNFSTAIFSGGDYFPTEHDRFYSLWGGCILGTHSSFPRNDIELVLMCYGKQFLYDFAYTQLDKIQYRTANLTFGLIYRPFLKKRIEINAGITGVLPISNYWSSQAYSRYYSYDVGGTYVTAEDNIRFTINPVVFQCGMAFYLARDRQD